ncbi:GCN5-related N-acetyltransferase [Calothrix parasitica NIES-267]|uniref:GCN5-related N-acetyltransferase n=1 Tax=Calothrix parasitica NIES-267 TaxID=1973488 RepID=A0A1Z4M1T9_9CYAN|nr:GCN5-related N-acetyltransferase [Calothrix parasitica NIES-267]
MLTLEKSNIQQLIALLNHQQIDNFIIPQNEEIAPSFLLELAIDKLTEEPLNYFWWSPRLIVVDRLIVGMCGFKNPPQKDNSVEIGYGVIPSQQRKGFATRAVEVLLTEAFSQVEIKSVIAHTALSNHPSHKVLQKNGFTQQGSKIDLDDGELLISGCAKLIVSLRATAKQSQHFEIASFHFVSLAMTNTQLILPKYLWQRYRGS